MRDQLILQHLDLVKRIAAAARKLLPFHAIQDDLEGDGYLGLIDAAEKFDPSRNVKFPTYASQRIRGAILDGIRNHDEVSRNYRTQMKKAGNEFHVGSLYARVGNESAELNWATSTMVKTDSPDAAMENRLWWKSLLRGFDPNQRLTLVLYYKEQLTMKEIGKALGLSESRTSQIHKVALARLRRRMGSSIVEHKRIYKGRHRNKKKAA